MMRAYAVNLYYTYSTEQHHIEICRKSLHAGSPTYSSQTKRLILCLPHCLPSLHGGLRHTTSTSSATRNLVRQLRRLDQMLLFTLDSERNKGAFYDVADWFPDLWISGKKRKKDKKDRSKEQGNDGMDLEVGDLTTTPGKLRRNLIPAMNAFLHNLIVVSARTV